MTLPSINEINNQVQLALNEDLGIELTHEASSADVTAMLISEHKQVSAKLICRESAVLCGCNWFETSFKILDNSIKITWYFKDGQTLNKDDIVCEISGNARNILSAERTALNFLQTLSATASQTQDYVNAVSQTACKILDTRKTIPGLRLAQKYAVTCGGGVNHRLGLYDMILIKENHIQAAGSITAAVTQAKKNNPDLKIEVEVENFTELNETLNNQVDRILLDNMSLKDLKKAVQLNNKQITLEASGNITLENIGEIASTGVDFISSGAITKNIKAIDFSLRFED